MRLRFRRITYRTSILLIGIVATVILAFNFWFIDHAEEALEQIVYSQSNGKLKLKVKEFKFNWIKNNIELNEASIRSTDTTAATSYAVNTKKIKIKARGFLPLLFNKEILIDSIRLSDPDVVFTRNIARVKNKTDEIDTGKKFSVSEEMGRISKSISDVINVLHIDKFRIDNGSFSLIDKTREKELPFVVNNVYIQLDNLQFDSTQAGKRGKEKITFTDNIAIRTFNQNLAFPGGRHFMDFKNFRINLANKRVEFDSCYIRALKGDSSKTSFKIFFDKLQLTNINFDSLYSTGTIMADSVLCSKPIIFLNIDSDQKSAKNNKETKVGVERIDAVIQQLLGDMVLNYIGVKEANIDVNTIKAGKTSTFSSSHNNFEIYGLVVRQNTERPVHISRFLMSLHNFENVLRDGRYKISFDSIAFNDDIINLNKFSFQEFDKGKAVKSLVMPSFQVRGLSWESLLYENVFSAQSASFLYPVVDYSAIIRKKKGGSKNLFATLNSLDDVMDLKNLKIKEGDILLHFGKNASLSLENTNLDLRANDFTSASKIKSVQRSVNTLNFNKGIFRKNDLVAQLNKVHLAQNKSGLNASSMLINSNSINATANDISLGNIILDSASQSIIVNGVSWNHAKLSLHKGLEAPSNDLKKKIKKTTLILRNINGHNTNMNMAIRQNKISGYFNSIVINEFENNVAGKPKIKGLSLDGRDVVFLAPDTKGSIAKMDITDRNNSVLKDIRFEKINQIDSILVAIPRLTIIPNITEIVSGYLTLHGLIITEPNIVAKLGKKDSAAESTTRSTGVVNIGSALFQKPDIKLTIINKNDSASYISWNGTKHNSYLKITNLTTTPNVPVSAEQIKMYLTNFEYISAKGKKIATNDNKLNIEFNDVLMKKNKDNKLYWQTNLNLLSLDKLYFDSLGKNNAELNIDKGDIRNIALNSKYITQPAAIIANSNNLNINSTNGKLITGNNTLQWYGFTLQNKIMGIDSFSLTPSQSVEAYRIAKAVNEDYLKIKTGKIIGGPIDMERFNKDSILNINYVQINDVNLFTFKDKTQPDTVIKYKPLPEELLKSINSSLNIDSLRINKMEVTYWETNPQTDIIGAISVTNLKALIRNIKNYNIKPTDSIYIFATANVLNELHTTLDVAQSYMDTTGFIRMDVATGPMQLSKFNTILVPLVGAKVFDGKLNSLRVHAIGNNDAAVGKAFMNYRGLNIGLLNKNDLPHQTFINKLVSKVAMAFIIRKNNHGKESLVFFQRKQYNSAINYIIKTTLEGIKSSIGLPGTKKKMRRYYKRIEKQ